MSMTSWLIHTLFTALKGYGSTKTKKGMDQPRRQRLSTLYLFPRMQFQTEVKMNMYFSKSKNDSIYFKDILKKSCFANDSSLNFRSLLFIIKLFSILILN